MRQLTELTDSIKICVETEYIEQQSDPDDGKYLFTYTITISNYGNDAATLASRHWIITDANGHRSEIQGKGVVGETPTIEPNTSFQYTSGTVLETPLGIMQGSYQMESVSGTKFDAPIKPFRLAVPGLIH